MYHTAHFNFKHHREGVQISLTAVSTPLILRSIMKRASLVSDSVRAVSLSDWLRRFLLLLTELLVVATFCVAQSGVVYLPPLKGSQGKQTKQTNPQSTSMTVDDVIKLQKAGLSDDLIIQQIRKKGQPFDLSADQIIQLKNASVSERVIQVMIIPASNPAAAPAEKATAPAASSPKETPPTPSAVAPQPQTPAGETPTDADQQRTSRVPPNQPGMYALAPNSYSRILGQPTAFVRTGSRLISSLTLNIKAAHNNIQLPGVTSQTPTTANPVFIFVPSPHEAQNGVTAGDLLLIKFETHGDRRQIEVAAGGAWRASTGVSITHQLATVRSDSTSGQYEIKPASSLQKGEYALFLQRGEGLPAMLYDFSVK